MPVLRIVTLTVAVSPGVIDVGTPLYDTKDAPSDNASDDSSTVIVSLVDDEPNHVSCTKGPKHSAGSASSTSVSNIFH